MRRRASTFTFLALVLLGSLSCNKKESAPPAKAPPPAVPAATTPPKPEGIPAPADVKAAPADAEKTASGISSKVLQKGTGTDHPSATSIVKVNYVGWMTDGTNFDASEKQGGPASFPLNQVIPGWTEGLQLMVKGEKRRFWIPGNLAYGEQGPPGRPHGTLVFDVDLLEFQEPPKPPEAPKDVKAAPKDAKKTKSGLAYKVLDKGKGTVHPKPESTVQVHYTGWTTDGKMFDSSVVRGEPATFPVGGVIKGWTEALQLMTEGQKFRVWIPAELAYGQNAQGGAPAGMLVFDIELLKIVGP